jgi:hypothetical protein
VCHSYNWSSKSVIKFSRRTHTEPRMHQNMHIPFSFLLLLLFATCYELCSLGTNCLSTSHYIILNHLHRYTTVQMLTACSTLNTVSVHNRTFLRLCFCSRIRHRLWYSLDFHSKKYGERERSVYHRRMIPYLLSWHVLLCACFIRY